jgi:hypothetical protein
MTVVFLQNKGKVKDFSVGSKNSLMLKLTSLYMDKKI